MPQLFPSNWPILYIFLMCVIYLSMNMIHFLPFFKKSKTFHFNISFKKNWKW
uniref:ATP synthase F0 subunit 8 n=1 Tax=Argas vulgaris TaxID=59638 RepID=UPI002E775342|nr:ATP synthase F0 subunit 8 [Argas vulgaris]WQM44081.1 ATP synthase F0 subunit 8 [Argas vulgaris]